MAMNRMWSMLRWVREKVNVKVALVALVVGTGLFTAYQCYARFGAKAPLPEPKKVVTGGGAPIPGQPAAEGQPAAPPEAPLFAAGNESQPSAQPPSQPPFAFNNAAFGGGATQPPPDPAVPAYDTGDNASPAQVAPYQPVVAGAAPPPFDPTQPAPIQPAPETAVTDAAVTNDAVTEDSATEPAPLTSFGGGAPAAPPVDAAALVPSNPIRGSVGAFGNDQDANQPAEPPVMIAEQPSPAEQPYASAPEPGGYANRFGPVNDQPVEPQPAPQQPGFASAPYQPPSYDQPASNAGRLATTPVAVAANDASPYRSEPEAGYAPATRPEPAGQGKPGDRKFEGTQTPALTLEKFAPAEIQVGKLATFELRIKNVGQIAAQQVQVIDQIPRGTQLVESRPPFQKGEDGSLIWPLGTMQPGDEQVVQLQVMPQTEGEIGSVAQVTFAASATSRSICTRPLLTIEHSAPDKLLIGETLTMTITVTNPGTGAATGVVIEEDVPPGLSHASGTELEYEVGTLRPGESVRRELTLRADKAGVIKNTIVVRGDGNLAAQHQINVEVIAPQLQVGITGPKRRFLERPATYTVSVSNPGTAAARDVELVAYLPRGMKFVDTDAHGTYDPQQHCVFWNLEELPASKAGNVKLTAVPLEVGDQKLRIEGRADLGLNTAHEQVVSVDAAAELIHTIADLSDPIEVGSETTYEVRVTNVGTKTATNIRITAMLPPELKALSGEGPTRAANDGSRVIFEPLARLNPQEEAIFRVQASALKAGDYIVRVQISSNEWPNPVTREESTRVYLDR
jgi:uncharacterized repeat protein (TIGR01451 family)